MVVKANTKKKVDDQNEDELEDQVEDEDVNDEEDEGEDDEQSTNFKPIASQDELDRIIQERVRRAKRSAAKELKKELEQQVRDEIEAETSRLKNEEEGNWKELYEEAAKEIKNLKESASIAELHQLKVKLLEEAGFPASAAKRILGETEDDIRKDVKEYIKDHPLVKKAPEEPGATNPGKKPKGRKDENQKDYDSPSVWGLPSLTKQN